MRLTQVELDRLLVYVAAEFARRNRAAGIPLSAPEAVALICDEVCLAARSGRDYDAVVEAGYNAVSADEVVPGVEELVANVQVEPTLSQGTLLVSLHHPIGGRVSDRKHQPAVEPVGEVTFTEAALTANGDLPVVKLTVTNTLDRAVHVTSHYHFFEANRGLVFDRERAYGLRLDIPAGLSIRFEPGQTVTVALVPIGGTRELFGPQAWAVGALDDTKVRERALERMQDALGGA